MLSSLLSILIYFWFISNVKHKWKTEKLSDGLKKKLDQISVVDYQMRDYHDKKKENIQ